MSRIRLCSAAEVDFTNALCWYAERNPNIASYFETEFDSALKEIAHSPDRFPKCDNRHRFVLMRRFPYQIIYRTNSSDVTIIAVAHTSREPGYWADR
ncbi:MAG: type II toxin-antitoxin system RelE/ParE family toxin [Pirellulaceae bacterium]|nr:type II toxin-antitoxin system RelE/ParE family toxin [Pirellulaceae bacterium]